MVAEAVEPEFDSYTTRRLGIRQGHNVVLFNAPAGLREALEAVLPRRARILHTHDLGADERANVVLIWPQTIGLFEQSMRELQGKLVADVAIWVVLDTEGLGLRERHVTREQIVAKAIELGYQDVGLKRFLDGLHALKLVPARAPRP